MLLVGEGNGKEEKRGIHWSNKTQEIGVPTQRAPEGGKKSSKKNSEKSKEKSDDTDQTGNSQNGACASSDLPGKPGRQTGPTKESLLVGARAAVSVTVSKIWSFGGFIFFFFPVSPEKVARSGSLGLLG